MPELEVSMEIKGQDPSVAGDMNKEAVSEENVKTEKSLVVGVSSETLESEADDDESCDHDIAQLTPMPEEWGEEEWNLAWKNILSWNPTMNLSITEELDKLSKIYQDMLSDILSHKERGARKGLINQLNEVLSNALMKVVHSRLGELEQFFEKFGTKDTMTALKAAVYRSVTGSNLTGAELEQVFKGLYSEEKSKEEQKERGIRVSAIEPAEQSQTGIIYEPAADGKIKNNSRYAETMRKETSAPVLEKGIFRELKIGKPRGADLTISAGETGRIYSEKDLELAERFARYINSGGNLLRSPLLTGRSEELWGFLSALISIKSQIFAACSDIDQGLASDLRETCDCMIDYYIQDAEKKSEQQIQRMGGRRVTFEARRVYKVFYYIMNIYQARRDINETANRGIRYAYQQFLRKKEYGGSKEEQEPFFTKENRDPLKDWKEGKKLVERDWKEFLDFQNSDNPTGNPLGIMELSPWGMFVEPNVVMEEEAESTNPLLYVGGGAVIIVLVIILTFFGF